MRVLEFGEGVVKPLPLGLVGSRIWKSASFQQVIDLGAGQPLCRIPEDFADGFESALQKTPPPDELSQSLLKFPPKCSLDEGVEEISRLFHCGSAISHQSIVSLPISTEPILNLCWHRRD